MSKQCPLCLIELDESLFYKRPNGVLYRHCRKCCLVIQKEYRRSGLGKIKDIRYKHSEKGKIAIKKANNTENTKLIKKRYRQSEIGKIHIAKNQKKTRSRPEAKLKNAKYAKDTYHKRYNSDVLFKLSFKIRNFTTRMTKSTKTYKNNKSIEYLGCSLSILKEHLEKKFRDGMTWENHGILWHIDHIIPLASAKTIEDRFLLSNYKNLQPLTVEENLKKGRKIYEKSNEEK